MDKIWNGKNYLDNELEVIVNKIKYLKPFKGYLACVMQQILPTTVW